MIPVTDKSRTPKNKEVVHPNNAAGNFLGFIRVMMHLPTPRDDLFARTTAGRRTFPRSFIFNFLQKTSRR